MNDSSVFFMSWEERMKILEVVIGSNHFFIQPQTVGKKAGAPMICITPMLALEDLEGGE